MKLVRLFLGAVCLTLVLPASAFVSNQVTLEDYRIFEHRLARPVSVRVDVDGSQAISIAARSFLDREQGEWYFASDPRTGKATLVYGSGVPLIPGRGNQLGREALDTLDLEDGKLTPVALEPLAREFIEHHAGLLMPLKGQLDLDRRRSLIRDRGRLVSMYFDWTYEGIPVEGATVFVRLNSGNITQFGSSLVGPIDLDTRPRFEADEALRLLMAYTGDGEVGQLRREPELLILPEDGADGQIDYRLAWRISYRIFQKIETWQGLVDAHTGDVIGFIDTNKYMQVVGGVYPRTVFDNNETRAAMPDVDVVVNGSTIIADRAGSYAYSGGSTSSGLNGHWFDTDCQGCSNPVQPGVQRELGNGFLDFGLGGGEITGNGFSSPADRNSYYHLTQARRLGLKWLPSLPWLQSTNFTSNVNINSVCNAVYTGDAVNFYSSGGGCNNTGEISDIVQHEWGHGLDQNTRGGDGGTGEATADVVAMHVNHDSDVGRGFRTTGAPVRDLNSATSANGVMTKSKVVSGFCGGDPHCDGEVYGQAAWELAQVLGAAEGHHTGWRISERLFFTSLPDAASWDPAGTAPIYDAYINADDDDGNLANGTPNSRQIFDVFTLHEISNAAYPISAPCSRPDQPVLNVVSSCDVFDLSWSTVSGVDHYEIFRSELIEDTAYLPVAEVTAGVTTFTDNEIAPGIDYWYHVMAVTSSGCESTIENPVAARLTVQPIVSVIAADADDTPRGNRSGFPDPGEEVDLSLSLTNQGEIDADGLTGTIFSSVAGVTLLDSTSSWQPITIGGSGANEGVLRFATDDALVSCGDLITFQFVPDETTGCATDTSFFDIRIGEPDGGGGFICDSTPACFIEPDFDGLASAAGGSSCAETVLTWQPAATNCTNAAISYNVYRSLDPGFTAGPANLVASGITSAGHVDTLLDPGQIYNYIVRAFDSRSGEESNAVVMSALAPESPDLQAPLFSGIDALSSGASCGQIDLNWSAALEVCNTPISYEVYRSTDSGFVPGPENLIGSSLTTGFTDAALDPGVDYTYIVHARDGIGNEDVNVVKFTETARALDLVLFETSFETDDAAWTVIDPNDATVEGRWEWGDPQATSYQPEDDATAGGVNCWITGLASGPGNADVDSGTTTLLSDRYGLSGAVDPVVRYARYFTNDHGASPGDATDTFKIDVSSDGGGNWASLEVVGAGTPLDWVVVELPLNGVVPLTSALRFRFQAADLGNGSLVEAGIDDFVLFDRGQGCDGCTLPVQELTTIAVDRVGDDVVLDWSADPTPGTQFIIYKLTGPQFLGQVRIGATDTRSFTHQNAGLATENFSYRVTVVDDCGNESVLN